MSLTFRPYRETDRADALALCIAAFTPIHDGFRAELDDEIFARHYPDWQGEYARMFDGLADDDGRTEVLVGEQDAALVCFCFTILDAERATGEIGLNAVAPELQGRSIGRRMYDHALVQLKLRGARIAYVGTGGDAAHTPARHAYEAVGFDRIIPACHYYRLL